MDLHDAVPGFVEIDLVAHDGGNAAGYSAAGRATVTDIATGWTENRSVPNKARTWVLAVLDDIARVMPYPIWAWTATFILSSLGPGHRLGTATGAAEALDAC